MSEHKVVLLPLFQTYHEGMSEDALYEAIRGKWIIAKWRLPQIEYAIGIVKQEVVGVYEPDPNKWRQVSNCWEFTGKTAPPEISVQKKVSQECFPLRRRQPAYRIMKPLPPGRPAAFLITTKEW